MTAEDRARRTAEADALCVRAYESVGGRETGVALVAVGGFGRAELAPHSDLDLVLIAADGVDPGEMAAGVWYPLWDSDWTIDHAVRDLTEMVDAADHDPRVASGLLDVRHLAGDSNLTLQLRSTMLAHWRRHARERIPQLRDLVAKRHERVGELAHIAVPDIKEAEGGLRDAGVLKSLTATWLVDVPHVELERSRRALLDVRDVLHDVAGRRTDRIAPEHWGPMAERLEVEDAEAAQLLVRELGRRLTHLSRLTWRRAADALTRRGSGPRRPALTPLADGVALSRGEVVLTRSARPADDPVLLLRAAAAAAEQHAVLAPPTAARLARECAPLPEPWPAEARRQFIRLLAAGRGLLPVWETLEETGALVTVLPEWEQIRLLPHASTIHRYTVDRHCVETCLEASRLIRTVARPDILMLAALLHDIGKGSLTEHSVAGAPIARWVVTRMGFDPGVVDLVELLVRWHLLLAQTATTRDPEDPATVERITERITRPEALDLLTALSEADARATSPQAWSAWRAGLVHGLADRARTALGIGVSEQPSPEPVEVPPEVRAGEAVVTVEAADGGSRVIFLALDRQGLLADLAAVLASVRLPIRAARVWSQDGVGVSVWEVADDQVQAALLRTRYRAMREGRLDLSPRLRDAAVPDPAASVVVRPEASTESTVLEVRTADRPGAVHLVCAALARMDVEVRSAHLDTLGPQAVDVFYVQEAGAGVLAEERAAEAAHAVRAALVRE